MEGDMILRCAHFAAQKHRLQTRKADNSSYIVHPLSVAMILREIGEITDVYILQAAILHDTVEDTDTSFEEIEREFGGRVCSIVKEVTDNKSLPKAERKRLQVENASKKSVAAKLVKLADKLHNLRDFISGHIPHGWTVKRVQGYFVWAYFVVEGLRGVNAKLEGELDKVFQADFSFYGMPFPTIPDDADKKEVLFQYYEEMSTVND